MFLSLLLVLASCGGKATAPNTSSPDKLYLSPNQVTLGVGATQHLVAFSASADGKLMAFRGPGTIWTSANSSIAPVSAAGDVTAKASGFTMIRLTVGETSAAAGISAKASVAKVIAVHIAQGLFLGSGSTWKATALLSDGKTRDVTTAGVWQSSDPSIISIDPVTGVAKVLKTAGTVKIDYQYGLNSSSATVILGNPFP